MSRFFAGILLLFCWTATAIRTDSDEIDSDGILLAEDIHIMTRCATLHSYPKPLTPNP